MIDGSRGGVIEPWRVEWTEQEVAAEVAVLEVRRGNWSSEHLVRLRGEEKPHVHQRHDITVTLLEGRVGMHIDGRSFEMRPGDVASIPHGATHWAENIFDEGASVAYAVFTPAYDGQDSVPAP